MGGITFIEFLHSANATNLAAEEKDDAKFVSALTELARVKCLDSLFVFMDKVNDGKIDISKLNTDVVGGVLKHMSEDLKNLACALFDTAKDALATHHAHEEAKHLDMINTCRSMVRSRKSFLPINASSVMKVVETVAKANELDVTRLLAVHLQGIYRKVGIELAVQEIIAGTILFPHTDEDTDSEEESVGETEEEEKDDDDDLLPWKEKGFQMLGTAASSDRQRVNSERRLVISATGNSRTYLFIPCAHQSSNECLSHLQAPLKPFFVRANSTGAGGSCRFCAYYNFNAMRNGQMVVFTKNPQVPIFSLANFRQSDGSAKARLDFTNWKMNNGFPHPPPSMRMPEKLLTKYWTGVDQSLKNRDREAETEANRNRRARKKANDESLLEQVISSDIPAEFTGNLSFEAMKPWVTEIAKAFPDSTIFLYCGKGTPKFEFGDNGEIIYCSVQEDETIKSLCERTRNAFAIDQNGNNFKKNAFQYFHSENDDELGLSGMLQESLAVTSKFNAVPSQRESFTIELETMGVMERVQAELPGENIVLCNEITGHEVGSAAGNKKINEVNEKPGAVFVTCFIVPESALGSEFFLNTDRNAKFREKLAAQVPGRVFEDISRNRSEKQEKSCRSIYEQRNARRKKRKAAEIEVQNALVAESNAGKKQKNLSD